MTAQRFALAVLVALVVSSAASASDVFDVTDYGSGYQIWVLPKAFDAKDDNYIVDEDASTLVYTGKRSLSGEVYYTPVQDAFGVLQPWYMEYSIAQADLPQSVALAGTWSFWARTIQPLYLEANYDPQEHFINNAANDSHLLLVKGDPGDGSGDGWYDQARASAASADDRILNDPRLTPDGGPDKWLWHSADPNVVLSKQFVPDNGVVTFRISERESHEMSARLDVLVFSSDPSYVPTDADFEALRFGGDANMDKTVDLADLAILATNWNAAGGWFEGDFTDDGSVDLADLAILATNWNSTKDFAVAAAAMGLPAVPEPATLSLLGLSLAAVIRRKR